MIPELRFPEFFNEREWEEKNLVHQLKRIVQGREISGLAAYE
jgi:hypothetical protein